MLNFLHGLKKIHFSWLFIIINYSYLSAIYFISPSQNGKKEMGGGIGYPIADYFHDIGESIKVGGALGDLTMTILYVKNNFFFEPALIDMVPKFSYAMTPPIALLHKFVDSSNSIIPYLSWNLCSLVVIGFYVNRIQKLKFSAVFLVINWPIIFVLLRGNTDLILTALTVLFFYSYTKSKSKIFSTFIFGLLVASKPHMLVFGLIMLSKRDFKSLFYSSGFSLFWFLFPLKFLAPYSLMSQINTIIQIGRNYNTDYAYGDAGLLWDNGLIGLQKTILYSFFKPTDRLDALFFGKIAFFVYLIVAVGLIAFSLNLILKYKTKLHEIWLLSSSLLILLSPVSASYRLNFFLPILLIYLYGDFDKLTTYALMVLILPKSFVWIKTSQGTEFLGDSVINPVIVLLLILRVSFVVKQRWVQDSSKGGKQKNISIKG
jgi:hypothetical protein